MKTLQELVSFTSKSCLITGAASGIGAAIARRFAEAGARLLLLDIDGKKLESLASQLSGFEVEMRTFQVDLSSKPEIDRFWASLSEEDVDILVNNAGIYPFTDFMQLTEPALEQVMSLNLYSVIWMCQHFIRKRIKQGGHIVNIGSIEAILPFKKDLVQYSLSKVGVITLTRDLAREYAGKNFHVNAILPGGIWTPGIRKAAHRAVRRLELGVMSDAYNFRQRIPAGRLGSPDEVAKMVLVLCSGLSSYVQGALIPVDGGFLSC